MTTHQDMTAQDTTGSSTHPDDRSRWLALYVLCVGVLMIVLDVTVVNVALPSIQAGLHVTTTTHRITGHPRPPPSAHRHSRR